MPAKNRRHAFTIYESKGRSGSQSSFEFVLGPLDHVVELFITLCELGNHDRIDCLVVDLRANIRTRGEAQHRSLLVAAWRIAIDRSDRRFDGFPSVQIVHALKRRQIVAIGGLHKLSDGFLLRDEEQKVLRRLLVLREAPDAIELRELTDE